MIWLTLIITAAVVGGACTAWLVAREQAWRWGTKPGPAVGAGIGPYREAETRGQVPRGVPSAVRWAAGTGVAWGLLTLLLFMPSGFFLLFIIGDATGSSSAWAALGATMLLLVACDGLILGFALLALAPSLLRGGADAAKSARGVAWWSTLHHFVVLATFVSFAFADAEGVILLAMSVVPCLLGLMQASLLDGAADLCAEIEA